MMATPTAPPRYTDAPSRSTNLIARAGPFAKHCRRLDCEAERGEVTLAAVLRSANLRLEDVGDGTADVDADRDRGQGGHHDDGAYHRREHPPERQARRRVGRYRSEQRDPSGDTDKGACERWDDLRSRESRADLLRGRSQRAREGGRMPCVEHRRPGDEDRR